MAVVDINYDEVRRLAEALGNVERRTYRDAEAIVTRGALNIKRDWRAAWQGHATYAALPNAVTYDIKRQFRSVEAEIGPDKDARQGALGNLIEFGSVKNSPNPGGLPALMAEVPRFQRAIERAADPLP